MKLPNPIKPENLTPGMNIWIPLNDSPRKGTVIGLVNDGNLIVHLEEGGNVIVPAVYRYREDVVTFLAFRRFHRMTQYQQDINSLKDLLRFACNHPLAGENTDEAAKLAFQLKASNLLGISISELFYD